ncbi:ubiquitin carboxyl-terminal hydrolase 8 [[Candida] railenensis]|uniref:Ubiquitin carboxyl-terminal hydrolase n=1 Tax=[Candida] railenensis TaxID=45579 RepID=A0A9P0W094_9ASCO|nr:ubiquitin carboxyl-terminal hydrolase 8 [[Candida] railenensis]
MSSRKTVPGAESNGNLNGSNDMNGSAQSVRNKVQEYTPPPDNYSSIRPCSHIVTVLDSKAKDTVFLTYRQALNISQVISNDRYYTQKKDGSTISISKLIELKSESLHCSDCSLNNFHHNFICLQCPHVGCFNNMNHAYQHFKQNSHFFGIDSNIGLLYCFMCGDYINDPQLEKIRLEMTQQKAQASTSSILPNSDPHYIAPDFKASTGLKGFVNLGSTCFMSCILQTFVHNPIIRNQFFNNDYHFFNCESSPEYHFPNGNIDESNACVTCSIDNIFKNFYTSSEIEGFGMTNLLLTAWYKKKSLAGFQEQDAHEFWQFILDELHKDYKRVKKIVKEEEDGDEDEEDEADNDDDSGDKCNCITHRAFSGELESSIKCLSCDSVTNTTDPTVDLSLEIRRDKLKNKSKVSRDSLTLYDCLDLFTKDENLDSSYKCQYCGDRSKAIKSLKIKKLAPVMGIQLKRFEHNLLNDTSSKVETPVKIPLFLDLTKYTSAVNEEQIEQRSDVSYIDGNKVYELFAMVCHVGSVNTGHYIAIIKDGNGQWFRFDDSVITRISQEEVMNTNAYLLYYITHKI